MLYMAVTPDEFELPLIVEDSISKLAKKTGVSVSTVKSSIDKKQPGTRRGMKFVKVKEGDISERDFK